MDEFDRADGVLAELPQLSSRSPAVSSPPEITYNNVACYLDIGADDSTASCASSGEYHLAITSFDNIRAGRAQRALPSRDYTQQLLVESILLQLLGDGCKPQAFGRPERELARAGALTCHAEIFHCVIEDDSVPRDDDPGSPSKSHGRSDRNDETRFVPCGDI